MKRNNNNFIKCIVFVCFLLFTTISEVNTSRIWYIICIKRTMHYDNNT